MRRPGSIFMMSIVLGALFAALVYRYLADQRNQLEAARRAAGGATVEVLVANEEIPIGTLIESAKVRLAAWPSEHALCAGNCPWNARLWTVSTVAGRGPPP